MCLWEGEEGVAYNLLEGGMIMNKEPKEKDTVEVEKGNEKETKGKCPTCGRDHVNTGGARNPKSE